MQDTGNLRDVKHTCGRAGSPHSCGIEAACTDADQSQFCRWGVPWLLPTQLVEDRVRAGTPQGERGTGHSCRYTHKCRYTHAYSHTLRCRVLSLTVSLELCVCDKSITPHRQIQSSVARSSLQPGFLIDILIGRFECRL